MNVKRHVLTAHRSLQVRREKCRDNVNSGGLHEHVHTVSQMCTLSHTSTPQNCTSKLRRGSKRVQSEARHAMCVPTISKCEANIRKRSGQ